MNNSYQISKVRKYFLNNPNETLKNIAERFNVSKKTIHEYLSNKLDLNIVKSLSNDNIYFLFNNITERKICTENDGLTIINTSDFSYQEKLYLKSFGLKIE